MSAAQLIREIESMPPDQPIDWIAVSERLNAAFTAASTSAERGEVLSVRATAIELVELQLQLHGDQLEKFIDACDLEYKRLIVQEALIGSQISFERMLSVTDREIAAGRMSEDFALREIAKEETGAVGDAPAPESSSGGHAAAGTFDRLKHWLHIGS